MGFERKTSGHKTKALASSKRIPLLFTAIFSSYAVVFRDGARHITMPLVRTLVVRAILYTGERLLSCSCVDVPNMRIDRLCAMRCHRLCCCEWSQTLLSHRRSMLPSIGTEARCLCSFSFGLPCRKDGFLV